MEFFDSFVEWFNGMVGLQYAGYGPITAIFIGILTVVASIRVLKFFFKPFAPLFQDAQALGESNPVLAQQGIRQSQLLDRNDQQDISELFEQSRDHTGKSRRDELYDMGAEDLTPANDAGAVDFSEALEDAWQHDQSTELRKEIAPLRPIPSRVKNLRPTASAVPDPVVASSSGEDLPILRIANFGDASRSSGAAHRMALRLHQGVSETLARIPNLAVEGSCSANGAATSDPVFNVPVFNVEGSVDLQNGGVHVAIVVRNSADGSELLARDMNCSPSEMQNFEKEVALEIAAAVIAHQRSLGRSIMKHLTSFRKSRRGGQSGSTYPSAHRPSPERPHRTDRPAR